MSVGALSAGASMRVRIMLVRGANSHDRLSRLRTPHRARRSRAHLVYNLDVAGYDNRARDVKLRLEFAPIRTQRIGSKP